MSERHNGIFNQWTYYEENLKVHGTSIKISYIILVEKLQRPQNIYQIRIYYFDWWKSKLIVGQHLFFLWRSDQ